MESKLACMSCGTTACEYTEREEPSFCSQAAVSSELHDEAHRLYALPENHAIMEAAAKVSEDTANSTRVQDTIKFANLIGAQHIGIASCTIMLRETRTLAKLLEQAGFRVETVGCKLESNRRADLNLEPPAKGGEGSAACNPIMQALLLNEAKTDLNILMGICVGHDALFCKYSDAPVTTLVAKDFLAGNNPCAVLYTAQSCYRKKLQKTVEEWRIDNPATS